MASYDELHTGTAVAMHAMFMAPYSPSPFLIQCNYFPIEQCLDRTFCCGVRMLHHDISWGDTEIYANKMLHLAVRLPPLPNSRPRHFRFTGRSSLETFAERTMRHIDILERFPLEAFRLSFEFHGCRAESRTGFEECLLRLARSTQANLVRAIGYNEYSRLNTPSAQPFSLNESVLATLVRQCRRLRFLAIKSPFGARFGERPKELCNALIGHGRPIRVVLCGDSLEQLRQCVNANRKQPPKMSHSIEAQCCVLDERHDFGFGCSLAE